MLVALIAPSNTGLMTGPAKGPEKEVAKKRMRNRVEGTLSKIYWLFRFRCHSESELFRYLEKLRRGQRAYLESGSRYSAGGSRCCVVADSLAASMLWMPTRNSGR